MTGAANMECHGGATGAGLTVQISGLVTRHKGTRFLGTASDGRTSPANPICGEGMTSGSMSNCELSSRRPGRVQNSVQAGMAAGLESNAMTMKGRCGSS